MGQYKYNVKKKEIIIELCTIHQGKNKTLENYIPWFKKLWQSIHSKLDESEIYGIFRDSISLIINLHAPSNTILDLGYLYRNNCKKRKFCMS